MKDWFITMKRHKWTLSEQASFLKRTGELLARGYPISEAIQSISFHLPAERKEELNDCLAELKRGISFHKVLEDLGFQKDLIGYVYFAEQHGSFAEALLEGSNLALVKTRDFQKLVKLLQYPALLILITCFLFFFIKTSLLPKFTILFHSMGLKENFFTSVIYAFDQYFPLLFYGFLFLVFITALYYLFVFRKFSLLKQRAQLIRIPIVGKILKLLFSHYFSIQLSFLLSGGISVSEALQLFERNQKQAFYSELGREIKQKLMSGEKLEVILSAFIFLEKELPMIVRHGQENGKLDQELRFFSEHCVQNMEELIEKNLKTIQPILYLFVGFLVISMYLAILLPMFHLLDGI